MSGLQGHLALTAACNAEGGTILRKQSFSAPVHISKPHRDKGWLVVNLASPSPGLLAGDCVEYDVRVEQGARLLLTSPSASRIHAMSEGSATLRQQFRVQAGGLLSIWPEYLIPQAGSRYFQKTQIELECGAGLLWSESIAPGRVAYGESFAFDELAIATDIRIGGRLLLRERFRLGRNAPSVAALRQQFAHAYSASLVCVSGFATACEQAIERIARMPVPDGTWLGVSSLSPSGCIVKVVAVDSPTLRTVTAEVRSVMEAAIGADSPSLRRVTGEPSSGARGDAC